MPNKTNNTKRRKQNDAEGICGIPSSSSTFSSITSSTSPLKTRVIFQDLSNQNDYTDTTLKEIEDSEYITIDFTPLRLILEQEPLINWKVANINVTENFRQYQREVLTKVSIKGLTWKDFYEVLALYSIIVLSSSCPYTSVFTKEEWQKIIFENPYIITDPVLPVDVSSSLRNACADHLEGKNVFLSPTESKVGQAAAVVFNNISYGIPVVSPKKMSEDEHCFKLLHPIIKPLFIDNSEYSVRLNRATSGTKMRPDVACLVNKIAILNSEIKPLGFTPLQQLKDRTKVQIRARESINQMLETKGGPLEATFFTNAGDLVESFCMDLKFDGLYRSWPFLTTRLVKDRTTIPLLESNLRHFIALERHVARISENYNYRSDDFIPPLQLSYMRTFPNSLQINEIIK